MFDAVCLASGGLDSLVCLHLARQAGYEVLPVFIDYGQRNKNQELGSLQSGCVESGFASPLVMDVSGFGRVIRTGLTDPSRRVLEDAFTPTRNLLFIVLGASVAYGKGARNVVLGLLSESTAIFPDQTDEFLQAAETAISRALGVSMTLVCPLRDLRKRDVVAIAKERGIARFYSCHAGGSEPCGVCIACLEYEYGEE